MGHKASAGGVSSFPQVSLEREEPPPSPSSKARRFFASRWRKLVSSGQPGEARRPHVPVTPGPVLLGGGQRLLLPPTAALPAASAGLAQVAAASRAATSVPGSRSLFRAGAARGASVRPTCRREALAPASGGAGPLPPALLQPLQRGPSSPLWRPWGKGRKPGAPRLRPIAHGFPPPPPPPRSPAQPVSALPVSPRLQLTASRLCSGSTQSPRLRPQPCGPLRSSRGSHLMCPLWRQLSQHLLTPAP